MPTVSRERATRKRASESWRGPSSLPRSPPRGAHTTSGGERRGRQGKPDGMAGEDIPLAARILAVAEGYEAMTAGRGCERLSVTGALERLKAGSGAEFDPALLEPLTKAAGDGSLESILPAVALPAVAAPVPA